MLKKRIKIGLALGAGGSKGLAHIGVIKVLEENNIPIDLIAGSSIGALVGGLYAAKKNISEVEKIALGNNWPQILKLFFDPAILQGFVKGEKIEKFIEDYTGNINFSDLKIPFAAVTARFSDARTVPFSEGKLIPAIRASISIPLLFKPAEIKGELYIDGGLTTPVPAQIVRDMGADIVIAINLVEDYSGIKNDDKAGLSTIANRSIDILMHYLSRENMKFADLAVYPLVGKVGLFDRFMSREGSNEVIKLGEKAMKESLPKLKQLITQKTKPSTFFGFFKRGIRKLLLPTN